MLALAFVLSSTCPSPEQWLAGDRATPDTREDVREQIRETCRALGASKTACEVLDVVTVRESDGDPCSVHVIGQNEFGLGPHGLSVRWQLWRWDRDADPRVLHDPAISTVVVLRLWRHALRSGARTWLDLQRVYGGHRERVGSNEVDRRGAAWCRRLARRGVDCRAQVTVDDVGETLGLTRYADQEKDLRAALERARAQKVSARKAKETSTLLEAAARTTPAAID